MFLGGPNKKNPDLMNPRGGTSSGPDVDLDKTPNPFWIKIQNEDLTKFEKDRLAILSMQGEYKVNFDFMETMVLLRSTLLHSHINHGEQNL